MFEEEKDNTLTLQNNKNSTLKTSTLVTNHCLFTGIRQINPEISYNKIQSKIF